MKRKKRRNPLDVWISQTFLFSLVFFPFRLLLKKKTIYKTRIIGGTDVTIPSNEDSASSDNNNNNNNDFRYPYFVLLHGSNICGGVLIAPLLVVTAAHVSFCCCFFVFLLPFLLLDSLRVCLCGHVRNIHFSYLLISIIILRFLILFFGYRMFLLSPISLLPFCFVFAINQNPSVKHHPILQG